MMHPSVKVQIAPSSVPATPSWFGEVAVLAHVLTQFGVLDTIQQRARFARARFGLYDTIDFVVVLIGYAVSGEPTLKAFYERLWPFASTFMALFGRNALPCHSTLSRFLAALDQPGVEALRLLFQEDLVARSTFGSPPGGVWDRLGKHWFLVDIDGTKQAARQRALPQTKDLPAPHRRFDRVCAKGYFGRKRGQVGRTRTTVLQPYTHQWLGTFSGPGNGDYRAELRQALQAITVYAAALALPLSQVVVRIDGLYGNTAPVNEILSWKLGVIGRSKQYAWLDLRRPSKPDSNQPLMPRLPILKAEPFAISTIVLPCHSPQQGLLSVFLSLLIQLVLTSLLLESYAKKPFTSSSTRRCHLTHLPHQMCCRCICTVDRLRRFYLMKIKSKIQTVGYLAQPLVRIAGRSSRSGSGTSV
jgi:hypothetical protein